MLRYFRQRRKREEFPAIWWPLAAPYGVLLTVFVMLLIPSPRWERMGALPVGMSVGDLPQPLAVLRMHAGPKVSLSYCRLDGSPMPSNTTASCVQKEFGIIPGRPLPKHMRYLRERWDTIDKDETIDSAGTLSLRPKLLLAEEYRSSLNWSGIRTALLEAKEAGGQRNIVVIEAEDDTSTEAVVGCVDLCRGLDLKPVLKLR